MISLPCECECFMVVIEKTIWEDGDINYNLTIQDSRYDHNYNTLWGRMKRATKLCSVNLFITTMSILRARRHS